MRAFTIAWILLGAFAWVPAQAADLELSVGGAAEYDSNVFRSENNEKDDLIFRVTPRVGIHEQTDRLDYQIWYMFPYEVALTHSEVSDLNHLARSRFAYTLTERTRLRGDGFFSYVRSYDDFQVLSIDPGGALQVSDERERVIRSFVELGAEHDFTSRLTGDWSANHAFFDSTRDTRATTHAAHTLGSLSYALNARHRVGGGVEGTWQHFDDTSGRPKSDSLFGTVFGLWVWQIDEGTSFQAAAGPTVIHVDEGGLPNIMVPFTTPIRVDSMGSVFGAELASCNELVMGSGIIVLDPPPLCNTQVLVTDAGDIARLTDPTMNPATLLTNSGSGLTDTLVDVFGQAQLTRQWSSELKSMLSYVRQASTTSGLVGSSVLDAVSLITTWTPWARWEFGIRGDWTLRRSVSDVTQSFALVGPDGGDPSLASFTGTLMPRRVSKAIDTQRFGVQLRAERQINENLVAVGRFTYNEQKSDGNTAGSFTDFRNFLVIFGVNYEFDPIHLW